MFIFGPKGVWGEEDSEIDQIQHGVYVFAN